MVVVAVGKPPPASPAFPLHLPFQTHRPTLSASLSLALFFSCAFFSLLRLPRFASARLHLVLVVLNLCPSPAPLAFCCCCSLSPNSRLGPCACLCWRALASIGSSWFSRCGVAVLVSAGGMEIPVCVCVYLCMRARHRRACVQWLVRGCARVCRCVRMF